MAWVFGAPPQNPNNIFWHCAIQIPSSEESKNTFAAPWSIVVLSFGAPPQNPNNICSLVQFKYPHPRYPKIPLLPYRVQWYWCLGRHPRTQTILLALCNSNTPSQVSKNTIAALWSAVVLVFGAPPQNPNNTFGLVQSKHPHPRYPRTPLLPYGVQWYWCLGRHPRTQVCMQPTLAQPR